MRTCEKCGVVLERSTYPSGKQETPRNFARRRFCSRLCAGGGDLGRDPWDRFMEKVRKDESGCWIWTAHLNTQGYGRFRSDQGRMAHRFAYVHAHGPVPDGMLVDHICRRPACVNPSHLRLLTPRDNTRFQKVRSDNSSGYRGVHLDRNGRWLARVVIDGKKVNIGTFDTPEAAGHAARQARIRAWGPHLEVGLVPCPTLPLDDEEEA